jgi:hypothetical protein
MPGNNGRPVIQNLHYKLQCYTIRGWPVCCKSILAPGSIHVNSPGPRLHRFLRELMPSLIVSELAQQQDSLPAGHWPKLNQGARKTSPRNQISAAAQFRAFVPSRLNGSPAFF